MSRSRGRHRGRALWLLLILALTTTVSSAAAQTTEPAPSSFAITPETAEILGTLREQWSLWNGAFRRGDREETTLALAVLMEALWSLEMETVPQYARSASAMAHRALAEGSVEQARWAVDAARQLDSRGPETAWARASLEWAQGHYLRSLRSRVQALLRLLETHFERFILFNNAIFWLLVLIALSTSLFVVVQSVAKGETIYTDIWRLLNRRLPVLASHVGTVLLLFWPVLLPDGLLWLLIYWSVLLWSFTTLTERIFLLLFWVYLGISPVILETQRQYMGLAGSPALRALASIESDRLEGSLFSDLGVLSSTLPEDPAVHQLLGDLHRRLDQWAQARDRYLAVLGAEPDNLSALIDLGGYYFVSGDLVQASEYFKQAVRSGPSAAALYNLSETYSASYSFGLAEQALAQARVADDESVGRWMRRPDSSPLVELDGGVARIPEIRRNLGRQWRASGWLSSWGELASGSRSLPFALALIGTAAGLSLVRRGFGNKPTVLPSLKIPDNVRRWRRVLVPGVDHAETGQGGRAFLSLLLPTVLLSLPLLGGGDYPLPWSRQPSPNFLWLVSVLGLAVWLFLRVRRELSEAGGHR